MHFVFTSCRIVVWLELMGRSRALREKTNFKYYVMQALSLLFKTAYSSHAKLQRLRAFSQQATNEKKKKKTFTKRFPKS